MTESKTIMKKKSTYRVMNRKEYRSKFKTMLETLSCIGDNDDVVISVLARKTNLLYYITCDFVDAFKESGFVVETRDKAGRHFRLTPEGIMFLTKAESLFQLLPKRLRI